MKVIILYGSHKKLTSNHFAVFVHGGPTYYVRAEGSDLDLCEALDKAKPKDGETVLNSVALLPHQTMDKQSLCSQKKNKS